MTEQIEYSDGIIANAEHNRFGLISVILLIVGCLGGITVGLGAIDNLFALSMVVITTMVTLSLLLAVAPMKYIFTAAIVALSVDAILLAYYMFIQ
ncbi:MAG: hypothetical protein COA33_006985 [Fluviicola sp.]|nr:hypothetical protein [Fluviicola sp.]